MAFVLRQAAGCEDSKRAKSKQDGMPSRGRREFQK
jgi:hypothetical protein